MCSYTHMLIHIYAYTYLCAYAYTYIHTYIGGDAALLLSDEMPEDDPVMGAEDIKKIKEEDGRY